MGLKVLPIWVHWAQSIYFLGTWTLRDQGDGAANAMKFMASAQHTEPTQNAEPRDQHIDARCGFGYRFRDVTYSNPARGGGLYNPTP